MIYFASDLHFCHDKDFVWQARGFESIDEMNAEIIRRWNERVYPDDDVYILGDLTLGDIEEGIRLIAKLNGYLHIMRGNHDTDKKVERYLECPNIVDIKWADMIKYKKNYFFLSHFPMVAKTPDDSESKQDVYNLHGHTHQMQSIATNTFYN